MEKGFKLYEEKRNELKQLYLDEADDTRLQKCRKIMVELFNDVTFKCGNLYKLTMSVTRNTHRFDVNFLAFKIEFYQNVNNLHQKIKDKKEKSDNLKKSG